MVCSVIVVAGESLVDLLVSPDGAVSARLGGAPFNVARGLARLGVDCAFCGAVGDDAFGEQILSALETDGVATDLVQRVPLPTTLAVAQLGPEGAAYRFYASQTAAPALRGVSADTPFTLYTGGLGLVHEPMASAIEDLVGRADRVFVDPNVRPAAIPDLDIYRRRLARVLVRAHVIKVSVEDLEILGVEARSLSTSAVVLVTDGARAAYALLPDGSELRVEPPAVDVVDTVGAGDAF